MMRMRKITITVLSVITAFCLCIAAAISLIGGKSIAGAETVEIMNDHFSVEIDANGYRNDFVTEQWMFLNYDKQFHETAAWLNDKSDGIADGMDLGNYLVINGKTFNELKAEGIIGTDYQSRDKKTNQLQKGGVWSPISVLADTNGIKLEISRGFADLGALTIGLKDGFTSSYGGVTYKIEGDLIFKATINRSDYRPTFKRIEELNENSAAYVAKRGVEADSVHSVYTGFRTFPLYQAETALNSTVHVNGKWILDNYKYWKNYIKINGYSVDYWNVVKYDSSLDYATNPVGNSGAAYSLPIAVQVVSAGNNAGEFKIWIHTEWAAKVGIDLNNFTIRFEKDMPFVDSDGNDCRTANEFIATRTNGSWSAEATEIVEVMNDNFSVTIDANGYRGDWVSNQIIYLKYNGNFHATAAWLNDKADGIADGLDLGNSLVINGLTFNEIKARNLGDVYPQIDGFCTGLAKGWGPVAVLAETDGIKLEINRGFADIGAMTIGLKDGFTSVYNGVTYKVEGDLTFKATINATDTYTPVFKRVEEINETPVEYASSRITENGTANGKYNCYRTFPLYGAAHALKATTSGQKDGYIGGRYLCDNYLYLKEYIKIDGYSINYWNIAKYNSSAIDCTTNPTGANSKQYNLPIVATINTNGEFQIYIHTEWAESAGIDLSNFTITFVSGMPYVDSDGNVCRTTNEYVATCESGGWHIEEVMNDKFSIEIDSNGYRNDFLTDQWLYLNYTENFHANEDWLNDKADGKADGMDLGNYLLINGKTFNELKSEGIIGTTYPSREGRANMLKKGGVWSPVAVDAFPSKIKIEVNRGFADLGALTIGIKDGFTEGVSEPQIFNLRQGERITVSGEEKEGYTAVLTDANGNDALDEMPERDYEVYVRYIANEYTLKVEYYGGKTESFKFTIENRAEVLSQAKMKLTASTDEYEYSLEVEELPLENVTVKEVKTPVDYAITLKYADGTTEDVIFNVENREEVLKTLSQMLTESTEAYDYRWKEPLPEELPLKNFEFEVIRIAKEYTLTLKYAEKEEEKISYTVETKDEIYASLAGKLTPSANGYVYSWKDLPEELPLRNLTIEEEKTLGKYTLTVKYSDKGLPDETIEFTAENKDEVYASLNGKLLRGDEKYSYAWSLKELPFEDVTIEEVKTPVEYKLTVKYADKEAEIITFNVETMESVYDSLADKLTADTDAYTYTWDKAELSLKDITVTEIKTANEYTLTLKHADGATETVKFTIENRDAILASLNEKLTAATSDTEYFWDNLPETLALKDITLTEGTKAIEKTGCKASFGNSGFVAITLIVFAAAMMLKKRKFEK